MKSRKARALVQSLRKELKRSADPIKASEMRAYMKSEMPYYGVQTPQRRAIQREVFSQHPLKSYEEWKDTILTLWRTARFREERYAAIGLAGDKAYGEYQQLKSLSVYEEFIVTGAWWDYVDGIAIDLVGGLLEKYPRSMKPKMRTWAKGKDIWRRRSAILSQLKFKDETDLDLLYDCIAPSLGEREFFLRKGIGWALREYAKTDPREVLRYIRDNRDRLSPLTKREAMRPILIAGLARSVP
jgi:3-methyladenine DNA glycosylase AlkD